MKTLYMAHHLGLGDFVCHNGMVRRILKDHNYEKLYLFCKEKYINLISFMYRDDKRITLIPVSASNTTETEDKVGIEEVKEMNQKLATYMKEEEGDFVSVGFGAYPPIQAANPTLTCDECFYKQIGLPYEVRFTDFYCKRDKEEEGRIFKKLNPENKKYIFVHDDPARKLDIPVSSPHFIIRNDPEENPFNFGKILENAQEIHCMESLFRCLCESYKLKDVDLFCHLSLREIPGKRIATRHPHWKIL
jgi:hypothetical protein